MIGGGGGGGGGYKYSFLQIVCDGYICLSDKNRNIDTSDFVMMIKWFTNISSW